VKKKTTTDSEIVTKGFLKATLKKTLTEAFDNFARILKPNFDRIEVRFNAMDARFDDADTRFGSFKKETEQSFYELKTDMGHVKERLGKVENRLEKVEVKLDNVIDVTKGHEVRIVRLERKAA
jgi:hypothetical protein